MCCNAIKIVGTNTKNKYILKTYNTYTSPVAINDQG